MFTHDYEEKDKYGYRRDKTGLNSIAWKVLFSYAVAASLVAFTFCNTNSTNAEKATNNYNWYAKVKAEKEAALDEGAKLLMKYENLQCSTRGLVVTTVKGITLCMHPETKALHKIDEKAD